MTLALDTQFDTLTSIDMSMSGAAGKSWYTRLPAAMGGEQQAPASTLSIREEAGASHLHIEPSESNANWTLATVDTATGAGKTWRYGYFEARMRFEQQPYSDDWSGLASWASFWLTSPTAWLGPAGAKFCEVDIFEQLAGPDVLAGTVHEWTQGTATGHVYTRHDRKVPGGLDGWHTFGLRWTPGELEWFLDDEFVMRRTFGLDVAPTLGGFTSWVDSDGQSVDALPAGTFSNLDKDRLTLILGTGKGAPVDVSHVRVWQA